MNNMNLRLQKDNSFNRSFERENGLNFLFLGQNKSINDFNFNKCNSINKNGSINFGFNPYTTKRDGKQPINLFVELADEANDDKNNDFLNLNILQKNCSSVRPVFLRDRSINSNFSLNMNTINDHMPKSAFVRRESSIRSSAHFENAAPISGFKTHHEIKQEDHEHKEIQEDQDVPELHEIEKMQELPEDEADEWVKSKVKLFENPSYNWNREVELLLESDDEIQQSSANDKEKKIQRVSKPSTSSKVNIRRHRKKSRNQLETLNSHFVLDEEWSLELVERLADELSLEKDQVYKWNWDKRKRIRKRMEREGKLPMKNKRIKYE